MKLNCMKPADFINPLLAKKSASLQKFKDFQSSLAQYIVDVDHQHATKQSEPNTVTNALKPFIDSLGYKTNSYSQKGHSGIDLAILDNGNPSVIFEAKKHNSAEMITPGQPNTKAFHESILYFMRERQKGNQKIFHIVITDFYGWYIFDAKDFDRFFWRDSTIRKLFNAHQNPSLLGDTTGEFYSELRKAIDKIAKDFFEEESIDCAVFDIRLLKKERELISVFKLLSSENLLKEFNPNDANTLNKEFYSELLYILGLEEASDSGKKLIRRAKSPQMGSFFENISERLEQHDAEHDFESVIKLIIIWVNRILFLKLLESQIVKWTGDRNNRFLNTGRIKTYGRLDELFFSVLAKPVKSRKSTEFDFVPYLNSSLFEINHDEKNGITIASLSDDACVDYYSKTVIKNDRSARKNGKVNTLEYLFEFLDAYDFGSESDGEISIESKALINASVLGLIFEKINGYKDGSFYTPSLVTMYMSRESIRKLIVDRFNLEFEEIEAKDWTELKRYCEKHSHKQAFIDRSLPLIDNIKICDPAVGSGHFLVSILNEVIFSKYELNLFQRKGMRLDLINDELLIRLDDEWFEYKRPQDIQNSNHLLQKYIFEEKQRIIENQLFGVDINQNSAQITKLRLWIELLKFSYYDLEGQLVTLPNIDINIKTGNSLVSRFGLSDDIKSKNIKEQISLYKEKVKNYKENIGSKKDVVVSINSIKSEFNNVLKRRHKSSKGLDQKLIEYFKIFGVEGLSKELRLLVIEATQGQNDLFGIDQNIAKINKSKNAKMLKDVRVLYDRYLDLETGKIYDNAFEWRFEFPEVLDERGDFTGFDLLIGNPPYGVKSSSVMREHLVDNLAKVPDYEIYYWFIERAYQLLETNGVMSFIVPNTLLFNVNAQNYRRSFVERWTVDEVLDCTSFPIFSDATVRNIVLSATKKNSKRFGYRQTSNINDFPSLVQSPRIYTDDSTVLEMNQNWGLLFKSSPEVMALILRLKQSSAPLVKYFPEVSQGLIAYDAVQGQDEYTIKNRVYHSREMKNDTYKPWINGADVTRYSVKWNGSEYISYGAWIANPRSPEYFKGRRLLIREITNPRIFCGFTSEELYNDPAAIIVKENVNGEFPVMVLLAILNSRLATFYHFNASPKATKGAFPKILVGDIANFPLPEDVDDAALIEISRLSEIRNGLEAETVELAKEIDDLIDAEVYSIYGCTPNEIGIIERSFDLSIPALSDALLNAVEI
jgi:adenine-specific DNA-methyltransferase